MLVCNNVITSELMRITLKAMKLFCLIKNKISLCTFYVLRVFKPVNVCKISVFGVHATNDAAMRGGKIATISFEPLFTLCLK